MTDAIISPADYNRPMKKITILFGLFIIAVIILADTGHLGFLAFLYDFPNGDKVGHFVLYGILSFLVNLTFLRALRTRDPKRVAVIVSLLLALAIGAEEFSQRFFSTRTSSIMDLMCSYAGVALGAWLAYKKR